MRQDRFLTGILAGVGILIVLAVGMFFVRQGTQTYIEEDTPEGVVHNYIFALQQKDYDRAYGYLANREYIPSKADFVSFYTSGYMYNENNGVHILETIMLGETNGEEIALVELSISQGGGGPFGSRYSTKESVELALEDGEWKIFRMPFPFWEWSWFTESAVPIIPR